MPGSRQQKNYSGSKGKKPLLSFPPPLKSLFVAGKEKKTFGGWLEIFLNTNYLLSRDHVRNPFILLSFCCFGT